MTPAAIQHDFATGIKARIVYNALSLRPLYNTYDNDRYLSYMSDKNEQAEQPLATPADMPQTLHRDVPDVAATEAASDELLKMLYHEGILGMHDVLSVMDEI